VTGGQAVFRGRCHGQQCHILFCLFVTICIETENVKSARQQHPGAIVSIPCDRLPGRGVRGAKKWLPVVALLIPMPISSVKFRSFLGRSLDKKDAHTREAFTLDIGR